MRGNKPARAITQAELSQYASDGVVMLKAMFDPGWIETGDDARYVIRPGKVAIPTRDPGLRDGDAMDCADFPLVWRAEG